MINKIKQERGITLVSLIITILVMAILIGVTVKVSMDDELIGTTMNATDKYETALVYEALDTTLVSERSIYEDGFITENEMWKNIKSSIENNGELKQYGAVKVSEKMTGDQIVGLSIQVGEYAYGMGKENISEWIGATQVAKNPSEYYGKNISNYEATNSGVTNWEIFHSDGNNIYLIAEDYIPKNSAPSKNGVAPNTDTDTNYKVYLTNVQYQYKNNVKPILENNPARKWLSYFETEQGNNDSWQSMRTTAYLLDTNIWGGFSGDKAEYAIGGPTLDLFIASYNSIYSEKIKFTVKDGELGYRIQGPGDNTYLLYNTKLSQGTPCTTESNEADSMWIASPSADSSHTKIMTFGKDGTKSTLGATKYDSTNSGLRPVICLKKDVKLERQDDGTYHIK